MILRCDWIPMGVLWLRPDSVFHFTLQKTSNPQSTARHRIFCWRLREPWRRDLHCASSSKHPQTSHLIALFSLEADFPAPPTHSLSKPRLALLVHVHMPCSKTIVRGIPPGCPWEINLQHVFIHSFNKAKHLFSDRYCLWVPRDSSVNKRKIIWSSRDLCSSLFTTPLKDVS